MDLLAQAQRQRLDVGTDALGDGAGSRRVVLGQRDRELLAADACRQRVATCDRLQHGPDLLQHAVADHVTMTVVD
ncbi:MAG: hypothetical protein DWB45_05280 [Xanthomonadales bacterium]|nr:hypothetical protein [Xanthomonadales bacterium]